MNRQTPTRSIIGAILGTIAGTALLVALIAFVWFVQINAFVLVSLMIGLAAFVLWAVITPQSFTATLSGRQARGSTTSVLAVLLLAGIVTLSYIIVGRENLGFDATAGRVFSLSAPTYRVFERIPDGRTVQITGFYSAIAVNQRALDDQFLRQYQIESDGQVVVEYIDPVQQPAVAQRFGVAENGDLFVSFLDDDGNIDFDTLTYVPRAGKQERDVTTAINRMLNNRVLKVYFDTSRDNLSIYDETAQGLTLIDNNLRRNGLQTDTLNILNLAAEDQTIPDDASVVVLARPTLRLLDDEVLMLDEYLQRGGSLFILADVTFNDDYFMQESTSFSTYLWRNYGIRVADAIAVDAIANIQTPLDVISYAIFTEPPIGSNLPESEIFFRVARVVEVTDEMMPTVANGRIISTSPQSHAERNLQGVAETNTFDFNPDEGDTIGPVDLAAWAWDEGASDSKIVLIGDADFITNGVVSAGAEGNEALLVQSLLWLSGSEEEITFGFTANPSGIPTIFVSTRQLDIIGLFVMVFIPLTTLLVGLGVWYRRNSR